MTQSRIVDPFFCLKIVLQIATPIYLCRFETPPWVMHKPKLLSQCNSIHCILLVQQTPSSSSLLLFCIHYGLRVGSKLPFSLLLLLPTMIFAYIHLWEGHWACGASRQPVRLTGRLAGWQRIIKINGIWDEYCFSTLQQCNIKCLFELQQKIT